MTNASADHPASSHDLPFRGRTLTLRFELLQRFPEAEETAPLLMVAHHAEKHMRKKLVLIEAEIDPSLSRTAAEPIPRLAKRAWTG